MLLTDVLLILLLAVASEQDLRTHTLPIYLTAPMFLLAIIKTVLRHSYTLALEGMIFTVLLYAILVITNGRIGFGGADFRMLSAACVYWGISALILILAVSFLAMPAVRLAMGNCVETDKGLFLDRAATKQNKGVPYAPPLLFGAYVYTALCVAVSR